MKRAYTMLTTLVVLLVCLFLLPTEAAAAEIASGTCGDNLTWVLDDNGTLTISGTGDMTNYSGAGNAPWNSFLSPILNVVIEDGVTSIGCSAFWDCSGLTNITIPNGVTSIGDFAFYKCSSLTNVTIPNGVTSIGNSVFSSCFSLTSVTIPNGVTSIGRFAFWDCSGLTNITIPNGVISIGDSAFQVCTSLTSVTIPNSVISIGGSAFQGCINLTSITIPEGVTSIGTSAFATCSSLTSVTIPNGVTSIGSRAFCGCSSLTSITIPEAVTSIGEWAFGHCDKLASITIPDSVISIGPSAFKYCRNLTSVVIGGKVNLITIDTFGDCKKLTHVLCTGSQHDWENKTILSGNDYFTNAIWHYNCTGDEITEQGCAICMANCTHNWGSGKVTKAATCKEEGSATYTCPTCNATKTEAIAKLTTHTYDNACDTDCNVCGNTRTITHQYSTAWSKDKDSHWHVCSVCSKVADKAAHTPGAAATETTAQTCTTCGYVIQAALGHTHKYGTGWDSDASGHWHSCSCGSQDSYAAHNPGPDATATTDQTCTVCGKVLQQATGDAPTEPSTEPPTEPATEPSTEPATEPVTDSGNNEAPDNTTTVVIIAAVVVLGGGGAAGIVLLKKKR